MCTARLVRVRVEVGVRVRVRVRVRVGISVRVRVRVRVSVHGAPAVPPVTPAPSKLQRAGSAAVTKVNSQPSSVHTRCELP